MVGFLAGLTSVPQIEVCFHGDPWPAATGLQHCSVCFFLIKKNNAFFITNSPGNKLDDLGARIVPKYVAMQNYSPAKVLQCLQH